MKLYDIRKIKLDHGEIKDGILPDGFDSIKVVLKASHVGYVNNNFFMYEDGEATTESLDSWIKPFRKPVITHHNKGNGEPLGRVLNATREDYIPEVEDDKAENKPTGVVVLDALITDEVGIEKVLKEEYLTVSVNSSPESIKCSICDKDIIADAVCEHKRGQKYEDKLCYWKIGKRRYKEVSFVNDPADASDNHFAGIVSIESPNTELPDFVKEVTDTEDDEAYIVIMDSTDGGAEVHPSKKDSSTEDVTDWTENDIKLLDWLEAEVDKELSSLNVEDAPISESKKKEMSKSGKGNFCGPYDERKGRKTFPVNDKAHYVAALRLLSRYTGPGSKAKIRACIERRGKAMGWSSGDNVTETITLTEQLNAAVEQRDTLQARIEAVLEEQTVKDKITELETKIEDSNKTIASLQAEVEMLQEQLEDASSKSSNALLEKENTKLYLTIHRARAELLTNLEIATGEHTDFLKAEDPVKAREEHASKVMNDFNSAEIADMFNKLAAKTQFGMLVRAKVPEKTVESPALDREPDTKIGLFSKEKRETGGQKLSRLSSKY